MGAAYRPGRAASCSVSVAATTPPPLAERSKWSTSALNCHTGGGDAGAGCAAMPVRHRELGDELAPPEPKRCRHCDESRTSCGGGSGSEGSEERASWRVTLDHDLVETLSAIYPEWFKPQHRRERSRPASPGSPASPPRTPPTPPTPPSDDTFSSSGAEEMAGRQAGSSGPSEPSSSPRVSPPKVVVDDSPLQPAMGKHKESLKVKLMMRRPINQLVAQGIMPPLKTPPAYFEQCKQLERAKTGDLLKAKIQRRPDRQELERRHILEQESHVDPSLAEKQRMLKKARLADQLNDQLSHRPGPLELIKKNILHTEEDIETAVKSGTLAFKATSEGASGRPPHPSSYCGPPDDASPSPSPPLPPLPPAALSPPSRAEPPQHPAPGKDKNRKKAKQKHQPKARFKFHEYKGPPSAQKASSPPGSVETPYELLLQQQQLLLQLMPASPAPSSAASVASDSSEYAPPPPPPPPPGVALPPSRFEHMKVSDLRAECKRRNLHVSGPKPQLIERLRSAPFMFEKQDEAPRSPASVASVASGASSGTGETHKRLEPAEDIVVSQRRQISELERKLEASRRQLEAVRREAAGAAASDQSRRLLQAHLCVSQLRAQLDALQASPRLVLADPPDRLVRLYVPPDPPPDARAHLLLNGVKVVPIAILPPAHHAPPAPPPPPTAPAPLAPPAPPLPPADHDNSQIMDDVLEILVQNGELPPSAVGDAPAAPVGYQPTVEAASATFAPPDVLSDEVLGGPHARDSLAAAELQRELDDIQNEILIHADMHAADAPDRSVRDPPAEIDADLTVDFLSDGDFHADFGSDPNSADDDDFFGSLLSGDRGDRTTERSHMAMDVVEEAPEPERTSGSPLTDGSLLEEARTGFEYMDELSLPSFECEERACDADMRAWGGETRMCVDGDAYEFLDADLLNQFGRGHAAPRDPLMAAVLPRAPPRPADKLYSWDRIEYDAS